MWFGSFRFVLASIFSFVSVQIHAIAHCCMKKILFKVIYVGFFKLSANVNNSNVCECCSKQLSVANAKAHKADKGKKDRERGKVSNRGDRA